MPIQAGSCPQNCAKQRIRCAAARPNQVRDALTQQVKVVVIGYPNLHASLPVEDSGQLPLLGRQVVR
jgi:hypothetical protein